MGSGCARGAWLPQPAQSRAVMNPSVADAGRCASKHDATDGRNGSDEDNLFNHPELALRNLEALARCGGNYVRCTLSCRDPGNVWPFAEVGGRYDLSRFNPEFWGAQALPEGGV